MENTHFRLKRERKNMITVENSDERELDEDEMDTSSKGTKPGDNTYTSNGIIDLNKNKGRISSIENGKTVVLSHGKDNNISYEIVERIGKGGFGEIFKCRAETGEIYALKKINTRGKGIPCLMEASIFTTYNSPYINGCIVINATFDGIYILQDVAEYDLKTWRRKVIPTFDQLKDIVYKVCLGIKYLHDQEMVHGDIKPSNILFYNKDDIRITDFSLTTYVEWQSKVHLCTSNYRPYELWLDRKDYRWSNRIDIWALGCTIIELYFNTSLFRSQGDDELKKIVRCKYINSIADWGLFTGDKNVIKKRNIPYKSPRYPEDLKNLAIKDALIAIAMKCLKLSPSERPSVNTILSDNYFRNKLSSAGTSGRGTPNNFDTIGIGMDKNFLEQIKKELYNYVPKHDKLLLETASKICAQYVKKTCHQDHVIKRVCVWIARKLIRYEPCSVPQTDSKEELDILLKTEISVCNKLGFKLH